MRGRNAVLGKGRTMVGTQDLSGRTALVTGASSGIGERVAEVLAGHGAAVACAARRADKLEALVARITQAGGKAMAVALDVTDSARIPDAFDRIEKTFGTVDILVNNAGHPGTLMPFHQTTRAEWDHVLALNLTAPFEIAKQAANRMIAAKRSGSIINVTSVAANRAVPMASAYNASKAALARLTEVMAIDLAPYGIRCNSIAPGIVVTGLVTEEIVAMDYMKAALKQVPLSRPGRPDDLAGAVLYFASDSAAFVTGAQIVVDGGQSIRLPGY